MTPRKTIFLLATIIALQTFFLLFSKGLWAQSLELASGRESRLIQELAGEDVLTPEQIKEVREILAQEKTCTEALERVRRDGGTLTNEELEACKKSQEIKEVLGRDRTCLEAVKRVQEKGGTLTLDELAACKQVSKILQERALKEAAAGVPEGVEKEEITEELRKVEKEEEERRPIEAPPVEKEPELEIFGHELFKRPPSTFAPITAIPVSDDYVIGPGDEVKVLMWGRLDAEYTLVVTPEGILHFPKIGPLPVAGLTYKEMKELIRGKTGAITGVNVSVTMGRLRSIQVFVTGEVKSPGLYTVSSLAAVLNALLSSGGPTRLGSLRNIQLKRGNRIVATLDVYDFLLRGDKSSDVRLMPGDVIFVPMAGPMVAISGNVKRPAIYELKHELSLREALKLAGGLAPGAYGQRIQIERYYRFQKQIVLDIPYAELEREEPVLLRDGDEVRVFSIIPESVNAVYLYGNVQRPGKYAYRTGLRLSDLLPDLESLKTDTYFDYALIKRYRLKDMKAELIPFDLGRLLVKKDETQNLLLRPLDEVYIFSKWMFKDKPYARIEGEIRKPGRYVVDKMRVKDLIFKAGNLTRDAYLELGHLYRTDPETREVTIHSFNVAEALKEDPAHNLPLKDMDRIVIHSALEFEQKYTVSVRGEVNNPGDYPYAVNMTVRDLILVAGSVKDSAYLEQGELVRFQIFEGREVKTSVINFDIRKALKGDPAHNLALEPLDVVYVKEIPEWGETRKVTIKGEVQFPGTYEVRRGERLSSLVERAGGFTNLAYFRGAFFARESAREAQEKRLREMVERLKVAMARAGSEEAQAALSPEDLAAQKQMMAAQEGLIKRLEALKATGRVVIALAPLPVFRGSGSDLVLEDGDELMIPRKPDTVNVLGEVYNPTSLIFEEDNPNLGYYLAKTGGPTENAEEDQIYVIRADGTVVSKKGTSRYASLLGSGFEDTKLYPGDTVLVPQKVIFPSLMRDIKDITTILAQIALSAGVVIAAF
ncbi:MAG: SLBB domain-containing protein [Deltaproteobacteria bacterium]|nr:SLBB domain-containing protein [Deltaproteobacteria bacterium]